jgi:hypothetical protein
MADDKKSGETGKSSSGQTAGSKTVSGGAGTSKSTGKPGSEKKG